MGRSGWTLQERDRPHRRATFSSCRRSSPALASSLRAPAAARCARRERAHALQARANLAQSGNVEYLHEDFRSFALPECVDLAVCAGDSLNYVQSTSELQAVLERVAAALGPGGLFLFDLQSEYGFDALSHIVALYRARGVEWYQVHDYDPATGIDDSFVITPFGVEWHRRRYISRQELREAASAAKLHVDTRFANPLLVLMTALTGRDFHALRRPG